MNIASTTIGQIVILDAAAVGLPIGELEVRSFPGVAQLDIVDVFDVGPGMLPAPSLIAAQGNVFPITGTFSVVPEPSTLLVFSGGLIGLLAYGLRRRRRE